MKDAQIHRFGDYVAISLPGNGETVYLSESEARKIAKALSACARDIGSAKFVQSAFVTTHVELSNAGKRG